jgi:hypothetical protein
MGSPHAELLSDPRALVSHNHHFRSMGSPHDELPSDPRALVSHNHHAALHDNRYLSRLHLDGDRNVPHLRRDGAVPGIGRFDSDDSDTSDDSSQIGEMSLGDSDTYYDSREIGRLDIGGFNPDTYIGHPPPNQLHPEYNHFETEVGPSYVNNSRNYGEFCNSERCHHNGLNAHASTFRSTFPGYEPNPRPLQLEDDRLNFPSGDCYCNGPPY